MREVEVRQLHAWLESGEGPIPYKGDHLTMDLVNTCIYLYRKLERSGLRYVIKSPMSLAEHTRGIQEEMNRTAALMRGSQIAATWIDESSDPDRYRSVDTSRVHYSHGAIQPVSSGWVLEDEPASEEP